MMSRGGLLVASAAMLATSGCGSEETVVNRMVSPQQELADLKRALDAGVITPSEYSQQIQKLQTSR
jgi:hypothetical protein